MGGGYLVIVQKPLLEKIVLEDQLIEPMRVFQKWHQGAPKNQLPVHLDRHQSIPLTTPLHLPGAAIAFSLRQQLPREGYEPEAFASSSSTWLLLVTFS